MVEIQRDGVTINYQVLGSGETTLLFVHGSYLDQSYWKNQVDYFKTDYKVVTLDLPGHGQSGKNRSKWTLRNFADDVLTIIDRLDLKQVILIGHSLGGEINLIAAVKEPRGIIGFIGIDNFKNAGTPMSPMALQQAEGLKHNLVMDFAGTNEQYVNLLLLSPATPKEITARIVKNYRDAYQPMGLQTTTEMFHIDQVEKELLPQLKLKLYLINVDYTPTNTATLQRFKGVDYHLDQIKGTSHFPMLEKPTELNELLKKDIRDILLNAASVNSILRF